MIATVRAFALTVIGVAMVAGCATVPTGPAVTVLPGSRKTLDQFNADDFYCRQYAQAALGPDAAQNANNAAAGAAVAGSALGAAVGAIIGSASGQAGPGAAIGAGTGLLFGSAAGGNIGYDASYAMQAVYDRAYMQCMYARGNQVPGRMAYRAYPAYPTSPGYPDYRSPGGCPPAPSGAIPPPTSAPPPGGFPPPDTPPPAQ